MPLVLSRLTALLALLATFLAPSVALGMQHDDCVAVRHACRSAIAVDDCCCHNIGGATSPAVPAMPADAEPAAGAPLVAVPVLPGQSPVVWIGPQTEVVPSAPLRAALRDLSTLFSALLI